MRLFTSTRSLPGIFGCLLFGLLTGCAVAPEPITDNHRKTRVVTDLEFIDAKRFAPSQPITLYDAMARAVAFNLQHSVQQIEQDIAKLELEQANLESLPDLAGDAGYNRDSEVTSIDRDRNIGSGSISGTWNLLDLGVSYARAQQSADRVLVAEERRRKGLQDIIRNVRLAYWKAVGAERLMTRMAAIERDFSAGLAESRRLDVKNIATRRRTVSFRRGLIDTVRQLIAARKEFGRAKLEFAQLVNIRPGTNFTLRPPKSMQGIPALPVAIGEMASFALANRPELRVEDYNERITDWESREALYSMFPGLDLSLTRNFSSDGGLVNTSWTAVGAQLGMNLFRLFSGPLRMQAAERRGELARRQRLALSIAVLAQVHISFHEYRETSYQFRLARQISRSDRELSKLAVTERKITHDNRLDVIDVMARQLRSEVEQHQAYVELRRAHGDMLHSLGLDVITKDVPLDDVDGLRIAIRDSMSKWENLSEDTDPANDGTIEELVGQAFADMRRDAASPGEYIGDTRPSTATTSDFGMLGMIDPAAGPSGETALPTVARIEMSPAGTGLNEPKPTMIGAMAVADMALAMTDAEMTGRRAAPPPLNGAPSTPAKQQTIAQPSLPDVAELRLATLPDDNPMPRLKRWLPPYDVQFGAYGENERAQALRVKLRDLRRSGRADRRLRVVRKSHPDRRVLFHVQYGAYQGWRAARKACDTFAHQGRKCTVVRHREGENVKGGVMPVHTLVRDFEVPGSTVRQTMLTRETWTGNSSPAKHNSTGARVSPVKPTALEMAAVAIAKFSTAAEQPSSSNATPIQPQQTVQPSLYGLQFGAYRDYGGAVDLLAEVQKLNRRLAQGRRFRIVRKSQLDKPPLYHVQYGAYPEPTAARHACAGFARQGQKCIVVRYEANVAEITDLRTAT